MNLKFGTGGIRAVMGEGPDCLNIKTIQETTLGVASYAKKIRKEPKIAICYDSRNNSEVFAREAALVFAMLGCKVWISRTLMPTPYLSYVVRNLSCDLGICITASHNSKEYNGYKVYKEDGCQITRQAAKEIQSSIQQIEHISLKKGISFEDEVKWGKIQYIPNSMVDNYCKAIKAHELYETKDSDLKIVYSPLNGAGKKCVTKVLWEKGFKNLFLVEEQSQPNGEFPTCYYPNPEDDRAMKLGIQLSERINADIFLATDPDSDRVGVAAKRGKYYQRLTGNQVAVLLLDYVLSSQKAKGTLPANPVIYKTIVTTEMVKQIAADYQAEVIETLTGFKYIGEQIGLLEKRKELHRFVLGIEESCGYLIGSYVRDKDAIGAIMLICEMADKYKKHGKSLWDRLEELYVKYGYYSNFLRTQEFNAKEAKEYMHSLRKRLEETEYLDELGGKVYQYRDYLKINSNLPKSNVLKIWFENGANLIVRPSGTEPIIKFYEEWVEERRQV